MINSNAFSARLKTLMEYYELSASAFSEEIDFNRSTISHLISGRNKPSLDFVMKVLNRFPEVTISWFLYGKGDFPLNQEKAPLEEVVFKNPSDKNMQVQMEENVKIERENPSSPISLPKENPIIESLVSKPSKKEIKRIVIFYTDSSFESYEN